MIIAKERSCVPLYLRNRWISKAFRQNPWKNLKEELRRKKKRDREGEKERGNFH